MLLVICLRWIYCLLCYSLWFAFYLLGCLISLPASGCWVAVVYDSMLFILLCFSFIVLSNFILCYYFGLLCASLVGCGLIVCGF